MESKNQKLKEDQHTLKESGHLDSDSSLDNVLRMQIEEPQDQKSSLFELLPVNRNQVYYVD